MTDLKLNETPIRTARNYRINNIKLKEINIPKKLEEFKGLTYIGNRKNVSITENNIEKLDFKYGNGDILQKQVPNKNLKIEINGKLDEDLILNFDFSCENKNLVSNIAINALENSKGTIIFKFNSDKEQEYFHNGNIKVIAENYFNFDKIIIVGQL